MNLSRITRYYFEKEIIKEDLSLTDQEDLFEKYINMAIVCDFYSDAHELFMGLEARGKI
jgi:hypothetical protein